MTDKPYSSNPGCCRSVSARGGTPGQCGGVEAAAVPHRYTHPRPHDDRLYVCSFHAESEPGAEPLTDDDRAIIAERRAAWDALLEPARRAGRLPEALR